MSHKPKLLTLAESGTGAALTASNGGIIYSNASTAAVLAGTATAGQHLQSGASTVPSWTTATYPATAGTSGNVMTSDGTNWTSAAPATTTLTYVTKTLTSAEIKALNGTPITVVAAPGAGKLICGISPIYAKFTYGGSNVFVAGAGQLIGLFYSNVSTKPLATGSLMPNGAIIASSSTYGVINTSLYTFSAIAGYENTAIVAWNQVATEISGNAANDNTITFSFYYYISTM